MMLQELIVALKIHSVALPVVWSKLTTIATITIILLVVVIMCSRFTEFGAWFVPRLSQQAHA